MMPIEISINQLLSLNPFPSFNFLPENIKKNLTKQLDKAMVKLEYSFFKVWQNVFKSSERSNFHNTLKLFVILPNFPFIISGTMHDCYL